MKYRTKFAHKIDRWHDEGESLAEHLAGAEDFDVAIAAYRAKAHLVAAKASHSQSQIFGDSPKLSQNCCFAFRAGTPKGNVKAMIDVIMDQRFLGVVDRILDRL
jgi:hypothetical protein